MLSRQDLSSEFIALCESQLALLSEGFDAIQTVVYLTQDWQPNETTEFVPVLVYPQGDLLSLPCSTPLLEAKEVEVSQSSGILPFKDTGNRQMVLPLVYGEIVVGFLVIRREERNWEGRELEQIDKIAETIAIAYLLERRQVWYEQSLIEMQQQRLLEQEQLSNLLHQIRNPITVLKTFGKLLLKRLFHQEENTKIITGLLQETEHLQDLLKQFEAKRMLNSAKSSLLLPGSALNLEPIDVKMVLAEVITSIEAVADAKDIELIIELSEDFPLLQGDTQSLREVFQNLLDNAVKYTPSGGKVKINTLTKPNWGGIGIHDTGCGIPQAVQGRIFERHYRGIQDQGNIPGTGLGLAIAKDLVEQMGGTIELISPNSQYFDVQPRGEGTSLIIWLTLAYSG